jgi:uroporphyrinogen decarboxylase
VKKRELFLKACKKEAVKRTPIWFMRQAGRYLPSYRKSREKAGDFLSLCKNPSLVKEVTLQPINELDFDVAILFSDILIPVEAMGIHLSFVEGKGPILEPIDDRKKLDKLKIIDPYTSTDFVLKGIELIKKEILNDVALIGFGGAPFTLATYAFEGGSSKDFKKTLKVLYENPDFFEEFLEKITEATILYLKAQAECGVDAIQLFDTWGGILKGDLYQKFSLPFIKRIFSSLKRFNIPLILYVNGSSHIVKEMATSGADVLSIDHKNSLKMVSIETSNTFALQGNLDPYSLFGSKETLSKEIKQVLKEAPVRGHIFNLGHGILPETPVENVKFVIEKIRELTERELYE